MKLQAAKFPQATMLPSLIHPSRKMSEEIQKLRTSIDESTRLQKESEAALKHQLNRQMNELQTQQYECEKLRGKLKREEEAVNIERSQLMRDREMLETDKMQIAREKSELDRIRRSLESERANFTEEADRLRRMSTEAEVEKYRFLFHEERCKKSMLLITMCACVMCSIFFSSTDAICYFCLFSLPKRKISIFPPEIEDTNTQIEKRIICNFSFCRPLDKNRSR